VTLDVMESTQKKELENPGGMELMTKWGGAQSGLPFFVILDAKGNKIADSNIMPGNKNVGYPGTPEEVAVFDALLQKVARRMTADQRKWLGEQFIAGAHATTR